MSSLTVEPGGLIHANGNGITTTPPDVTWHIVNVAEEIAASERMLPDYLEGASSPTLPEFREASAEIGIIASDLGSRIGQ